MKRKVYGLLSLLCSATLIAGTFAGCGSSKDVAKDDTILEDDQTPLGKEDVTEDNDTEVVEDTEEEEEAEAELPVIPSTNNRRGGNRRNTTDNRTNAISSVVVENTPLTTGDSHTQTSQGGQSSSPVVPDAGKLDLNGYTLVWADEFEGDGLDRTSWNVELHNPGWVNNEEQAYVDSEENIKVEDGKLVITPVKKDDPSAKYTSGRVNTQDKHTFTYGYFECRAKVPAGHGFLPAFWMMPNQESLYGQWPRCGEIDIMEVVGDETDVAYGTIHYGYPQKSSQGKHKATGKDYAEDFHTYGIDWEPGKLTWYIDGVKYYEESDWYTGIDGQEPVSYPAPFDQPFYLILNLAVGGTWPGEVDETIDFANQPFVIDYVRAYQREAGYSEEGLERPVKESTIRTPDENGNVLLNGNFAAAEDFSTEEGFQFMTQKGGEGTATVVSDSKFAGAKALKITSTAVGTEDYAVQFVQANVPVEQGYHYTVSFDAYADDERTMITAITAPECGWGRYLPDTKLNLTTEPETYTYEFDMTSKTDAAARFELNLGKQDSTATVYVTNIKVTRGDSFPIDVAKKPLADGNHIYNGQFQEGTNKMGFWTVTDESKTASYKVSGLDTGRRLEMTTQDAAAVLSQDGLPVAGGVAYAFSMDAISLDGTDKTFTVNVLGNSYEFTATAAGAKCSQAIVAAEDLTDKAISISFPANSKIAIDNLVLTEDALIKNGSFDAGPSNYDLYVNSPASASMGIDSLAAGNTNACEITINDTGVAGADNSWYIQLKQSNVRLEEGQWYRLSFKAKSTIARQIMYQIQKDQTWDQYCQDWVDLPASNEYTVISKDFQMPMATDSNAIFDIALGSMDDNRITTQHIVTIDDIVLEKIDEPMPEIPTGVNLLKNASFENNGFTGWENVTNGNEASFTADNGVITYDVKDFGTADWNVQTKQSGVALENGCKYRVKMTFTSTVNKKAKYGFMSQTYAWYAGEDLDLVAGETKEVDATFTMNSDTNLDTVFYISVGQFDGETAPADGGVITVANIYFEKITD